MTNQYIFSRKNSTFSPALNRLTNARDDIFSRPEISIKVRKRLDFFGLAEKNLDDFIHLFGEKEYRKKKCNFFL